MKSTVMAGLALLVPVLCANPAHAQGYAFSTGAQSTAPGGLAPVSGTVAVFPYVQFGFPGGTSSLQFFSILAAGEASFGSPHPGSFAVGGWYFHQPDFLGLSYNLFELHGRVNLNRFLGVQLGGIGDTNAAPSYDAFLVGTFDSRELSPRLRPYWALQVGAGPYVDTSSGSTTADFSGYLSGRIGIYRRLHFDASYWYIQDRGSQLNRTAVGIGYDL